MRAGWVVALRCAKSHRHKGWTQQVPRGKSVVHAIHPAEGVFVAGAALGLEFESLTTDLTLITTRHNKSQSLHLSKVQFELYMLTNDSTKIYGLPHSFRRA
jgi:hypothetical protein